MFDNQFMIIMYCLHEMIFAPRCQKKSCKRSWEQARETLWADSICWSIRAWRYWDIRNSSQHYWKTSETAMGCTSAAFTYQKYMKTSHSWAEVNESSKISVFPKAGSGAGALRPCIKAAGPGSVGSWENQVTRHDEKRQEIHKFKQKKDCESVIESFWLPARPETSSRGCSHWNYKTTSPPSLQAWMKPVPILRLWSSQKVKSVWTAVNH